MKRLALGLTLVTLTACATRDNAAETGPETTAAKSSVQPKATAAAEETSTKASKEPRVTGTDKRPKLPAPPKLAAAKPAPQPSASPKATAKPARRGPMPLVVQTAVLNIRSKPSTNGRIVGKLTRGTMLPVTVEGEWARLADGQWVLARYMGPAH